ncbi:hypothetical protein [Haloplanus salilacus]|uniref:hypothetical protein n=1 Tax=Haloplanus salilacus TaxID=2949994 RepID=UPI0030CE74C9
MARTEETYEGHSIVVEDGDGLVLTVDGNEVAVNVDDHGPKTLYRHRDSYRSFEDAVELARALVDEGVVP